MLHDDIEKPPKMTLRSDAKTKAKLDKYDRITKLILNHNNFK